MGEICAVCKEGMNASWMVDDFDWQIVMPTILWEESICWKCYCEFRKTAGFPQLNKKEVQNGEEKLQA